MMSSSRAASRIVLQVHAMAFSPLKSTIVTISRQTSSAGLYRYSFGRDEGLWHRAVVEPRPQTSLKTSSEGQV
eukprot:CAMPEP_0182465702 /NCGR_PEP_ID=MMETSP1319-20130603/10452_1 /TAXON_ID=172717 /ORGANISM="Bolidomonas pacifica, Strain RCC208" /LENGTH=72 /DNA_ID=CAMNT_0024665533 /DNA_START=39 /DNA_END=253 /DNA_ORIENTATION=-